jgi:hypothetical protein
VRRHGRVPHVLRLAGGVAVLWTCALVLTALIVLGIGAGTIR